MTIGKLPQLNSCYYVIKVHRNELNVFFCRRNPSFLLAHSAEGVHSRICKNKRRKKVKNLAACTARWYTFKRSRREWSWNEFPWNSLKVQLQLLMLENVVTSFQKRESALVIIYHLDSVVISKTLNRTTRIAGYSNIYFYKLFIYTYTDISFALYANKNVEFLLQCTVYSFNSIHSSVQNNNHLVSTIFRLLLYI